ncbi:MAG: methionyl-tRNA formyltransferase [Candidatus Eremiobacteraeota bacterium]|nr:methionyl-tRNA formyltransferase [Candidatus Eremiobacteraeota bacterium]
MSEVSLKVIFMGSEKFSIPSLEVLAGGLVDLLAVITCPDSPSGRGRKYTPSPVKKRAMELGIPVKTPDSLRTPEFIEWLELLFPDLIILASYGKILPKEVLDIPRLGCLNVHPSLLPRHRGATPVEAAIIAGDKKTGVTLFLMDEGCDTGDILFQEEVEIGEEETGQELSDRLAELGSDMLKKYLPFMANGKFERHPQDREAGSYAHLLKKEDLRVDWNMSAEQIARRIRAFATRPGKFTKFRGKILKIYKSKPVSNIEGTPGEILEVRKGKGPVIGTGKGALLLSRVQPEGRKVMDGGAFINGYQPKAGEVLGEGG